MDRKGLKAGNLVLTVHLVTNNWETLRKSFQLSEPQFPHQ